MSDYETFIASKSATRIFDGIEARDLNPSLFPHQRDLTRWALRKGRAAVFAATGLGKTIIELEWAKQVAARGRVLMLAPLAVAQQTVAEGERFGYSVAYARHDTGERIIITNYEMLHAFDTSQFIGVVLDESSILKALSSKTRAALTQAFRDTPYRLAATATPAPNDYTELGNHAEFLGITTHSEMLSEYFVHDGGSTQDWRLKGHAVTAFWTWVSSWGALVNTPADLGHDDTAYRLPALRSHDVVLPVDHKTAHAAGFLFAEPAATLSDQRAIRRATLDARAAKAAEIANSDNTPCIVWCELNDESKAVHALIPDSVEVSGADSLDEKIAKLHMFASGGVRVMVTKSSVCGFGLNLQHCSRMVFVGSSHSYEGVYQSIRRCWRFGQTKPVDVYTVRAETEQMVVDNYRRKEADAARMAAEMSAVVGDMVRAEVCGATGREFNEYAPAVTMVLPSFLKEES